MWLNTISVCTADTRPKQFLVHVQQQLSKHPGAGRCANSWWRQRLFVLLYYLMDFRQFRLLLYCFVQIAESEILRAGWVEHMWNGNTNESFWECCTYSRPNTIEKCQALSSIRRCIQLNYCSCIIHSMLITHIESPCAFITNVQSLMTAAKNVLVIL